MDNVTLYSLDENLQTQEHGQVTRQTAMEAIDRYSAAQPGLTGSAEHVLSYSMFGFSLDDRTFIEIALETDDTFRVKFETPEPKQFLFLRLPGLFQKEITVAGKDDLKSLVEKFFELSLEDFKSCFQAL